MFIQGFGSSNQLIQFLLAYFILSLASIKWLLAIFDDPGSCEGGWKRRVYESLTNLFNKIKPIESPST
jgi:hypothetical protein